MKKSLLLVVLLSLTSFIVSAKSYSLSFVNATKVGGTQLAKGVYSVKLEGDKLTFTDDHSKSVSVAVKVDAGTGKKYEFTSVEATQKDGTDVVKLIHLGGSNTTLEFAD